MSSHSLGWLGTGRMGSALATRLLRGGHDVAVWNRTASKAQALEPEGATVVSSIQDLGKRDVVFVMVSTPADLEQVILGPGGLASGDTLPQVVVDCSTVGVGLSAQVRAELGGRGIRFLAAPVSGNPHVVAEGGSVFVASGPRDTYNLVQPYLDVIGKRSVYAGPQEQARIVKLAHNLYLGVIVQSLSEVTALAEKSGVPRRAFLDFLNSTALAAPWVQKRTPDLLALDWTPTFTTELLRKDFDLGLAAARHAEVPMPVAASVHQLIQAAIGRGFGDKDFLSLFAVEAGSAGMDIVPES